ncbi:MAG: polysaccharide lyase family 1 protein [Candidatus Hodarchaeota archaeon]
MKRNNSKLEIIIFIAIFLAIISSTAAYSGLPAFPGAEGFGTQTPGGRGGRVYEVTNLNDSGTGSLRAAIEARGPRIVVFRTGGTIDLDSTLSIGNPYITIAGQTAPGGGITIKGADIRIATHDVVIRYITSRRGPGGENHALTIYAHNSNDVYNIVIDHCSLSWATDECFSTWYRVYNVTIQWSIISEGLDCSTHPKGCHSKGALLGGSYLDEAQSGTGAYNISFHHNLIAHQGERLPLITTAGTVDVVNNVLYNPYWAFSYVSFRAPTITPVNYVKNYFKYGPDSSGAHYEIRVIDDGGNDAEIYVEGNIGPNRASDNDPENYCVRPDSRSYIVGTRHTAPEITETSATGAYTMVLNKAGNYQYLNCDGSWFSRRDSVDQRIVSDVQNGTGRIIDDPSEVGGWLIIATGMPCADSDHDGMPDAWENLHGFNPSSASDSIQDFDNDGYTNIEEYLNGTDPKSEPDLIPPDPPRGVEIQ